MSKAAGRSIAACIGYTFAMRASITASLAFLLLLLTGCQHETPTFKFQIVDAQTRQGLANVKVETILTGSQMGIGALPVDEDDFDSSIIARTDASGLATLTLKVPSSPSRPASFPWMASAW